MAWDSFKDIFHSVLDIVAPLKEVKLKQRTEPWMNSDILQNIRHRDETLNKFRKSKDPDLYKEYCKLRNMVQRETRISKRDYLANKIEENVGNSKKLWNQLKKLGYSSKKKENSSVVLETEGETCFDPQKVANCFNNFFTTVASNLVDKLPPSFNLFNTDSSRFQEFYAGKNVEPDEFILAPVSEDFIYRELCKLNPSKSTGTDNIPARFVKDAASVLTKPILHIINLSSYSPVLFQCVFFLPKEPYTRRRTFCMSSVYYPSCENKGADQLRSDCEADLHLCFRKGNNPVFSWRGSHVMLRLHRATFSLRPYYVLKKLRT